MVVQEGTVGCGYLSMPAGGLASIPALVGRQRDPDTVCTCHYHSFTVEKSEKALGQLLSQ